MLSNPNKHTTNGSEQATKKGTAEADMVHHKQDTTNAFSSMVHMQQGKAPGNEGPEAGCCGVSGLTLQIER
jgi:hypothetical protein